MAAPRAGFGTSSFASFARSGRVTHTEVWKALKNTMTVNMIAVRKTTVHVHCPLSMTPRLHWDSLLESYSMALCEEKGPQVSREILMLAVLHSFAPVVCSQPDSIFHTRLRSKSQRWKIASSSEALPLSPKYGSDSNYCGLKSVPSLHATKQMFNAFGGVCFANWVRGEKQQQQWCAVIIMMMEKTIIERTGLWQRLQPPFLTQISESSLS